MFKNLHPQYDVLVYGEDGVKLTAKERRLIHLYEDDGDVTLLPDPEPAEAVAPLSSRLDIPLRNSPYPASSMSMSVIPSILSVAPLSSRFDTLPSDNPYSTLSTSTLITNSISSSASAPCRNTSGSDSFRPVCPAKSNACLQDYRGPFRQPKARNKGHSVYKHPFESGHDYVPPSPADL